MTREELLKRDTFIDDKGNITLKVSYDEYCAIDYAVWNMKFEGKDGYKSVDYSNLKEKLEKQVYK